MKRLIFAIAVFMAVFSTSETFAQQETAPFKLPELAYGYSALEPYIDSMTMDIHHSKHHAAYVKNLNDAIKNTAAENMTLEEILANTAKFDMKVRNNAGGVYNHNLFFAILSPQGGKEPQGELLTAINMSFGSFSSMKAQLNQAASTRFGSGWAWLYVNDKGRLAITSTPNQDNPLMDIAENKGIPILGIDVWEHAYYLKYQYKRGDYLSAIWNVINWEEVARRYSEAINK